LNLQKKAPFRKTTIFLRTKTDLEGGGNIMPKFLITLPQIPHEEVKKA
jgi:hypothetical protein